MLKACSLKIDGRVISYYKAGRGQEIILLPGLGANCNLWMYVLPILARFYKVYAFSLPHYGSHDTFGHVYDVHTYHFLLQKLINRFQIKYPILIGHSLGAIISVIYAAEYPELVSKLILVCAPFSDHRKKPPLLWKVGMNMAIKRQTSQGLAKWLISHPKIIELILSTISPGRYKRSQNKLFKWSGALPIKSMAKCYSDLLNHSFKKYLERIQTPTLFIYGTKDWPINTIGGTALYHVVKDAKIVSLPYGHFIPTDMPDELSRLIIDFVHPEQIYN